MRLCDRNHSGPYYRVNPKGEIPGEFWCEDCIYEYGADQSLITQDLHELCEMLQKLTSTERWQGGA